MSIEAMKQVLDALHCIESPLHVREIVKVGKAMGIMRKAIEAAEAEKQEPVAWVQDVEFEQLPEFAFSWVKTRLHDKPLYTHPPKREPLTDEQIINEADGFDWDKDCAVRFARAIEAKLREKNA